MIGNKLKIQLKLIDFKKLGALVSNYSTKQPICGGCEILKYDVSHTRQKLHIWVKEILGCKKKSLKTGDS